MTRRWWQGWRQPKGGRWALVMPDLAWVPRVLSLDGVPSLREALRVAGTGLVILALAVMPQTVQAQYEAKTLIAGFDGQRSPPPGAVSLIPANALYGAYNVKASIFGGGAVGNGVANDTPPLQLVIDAATAAGGGTIFVPPGTYLCAQVGSWDYGPLGLGVKPYALALGFGLGNNAPNLLFVGAGRNVSILKKTTSGGSVLNDYNLILQKATSGTQGAWNTFVDLGFDGAQMGANAPFTGGDEHLLMMPTANWIAVDRCQFLNARGGGMYLWKARFGKITNSHFDTLDRAGVNNAITVIGGNALIAGSNMGGHAITNCSFNNNGQISIAVGGFAGSGEIDGVTISTCVFVVDTAVAPSGLGIELVNAGGADLLKRTTITGCVFEGGSGMTLQGSDTQVQGCTFRQMNRGGGLGNAIQFNNAPGTFRCSITNCSVDTCTNNGFDVTGTRTQISGCSITGCATGINIQAAATGTQLTGNNLVGNATPVTDAGTGTVRTDNQLTTGVMQGRAVLVAGTVTVATTEIQAGDNVLLTRVVQGGTAHGDLEIGAIVAGTNFAINAKTVANALEVNDTSTIFFKIVH